MVQILQDFICLSSVVQNSGGLSHEAFGYIGLGDAVMESHGTSIWHCWHLSSAILILIFMSFVLSVLLHGCDSWILTRDMEGDIETFDSNFRWGITRNRQLYCLLNRRHLNWIKLIVYIVLQLCLRHYGIVTRSPEVGHAHQLLLKTQSLKEVALTGFMAWGSRCIV